MPVPHAVLRMLRNFAQVALVRRFRAPKIYRRRSREAKFASPRAQVRRREKIGDKIKTRVKASRVKTASALKVNYVTRVRPLRETLVFPKYVLHNVRARAHTCTHI